MALKQIMMNNGGGLMSQDEINKFYQDGANGMFPQLKKGLGIVDNTPMDAPADESIVPMENNNVVTMNNEPIKMKGLGMSNQNPIVDYDQSQDYNQPPLQAGQRKNGVDWRSVASYIGAFGDSANGNNISERINNGMGGVSNHMRDVNTYNAYRPYYDQMGVDTTYLNPAHGGSGYGQIKPDEIVKLQYALARQKRTDLMDEARLQKWQNDTSGVSARNQGKTMTYADAMRAYPAFKQSMQGQYDFSNGQNQELLNSLLPSAVVQKMMPSTVNYTGGTNSTKHNYGNSVITHRGGTNSTKTNYGSKYPNPSESPYKEGQTATNGKTGEKMIFKNGKWHQI